VGLQLLVLGGLGAAVLLVAIAQFSRTE